MKEEIRVTDLLTSIKIDKSKCKLCGTCVGICPKNVYSKQGNEIIVDTPEDCIGCLVCERACPKNAITVENRKIKKFFISRRCNNACIMCFEHDKNIKKDFTTEELIETFEKEIKGTEELIVLSGAEITTRNDLFKLLLHIRKRNKTGQIFLPTNGRMFSYKKYADKFASLKLGDVKITVSVLGTREAHDRITCVKGSFEQAVTGVKNLLAHNQNVHLNITILKQNYKTIPEICRYFLKLGVRSVQLAIVEPSGDARKIFEKIMPRMDEAMPFIIKALGIGKGKVKTKNIPSCFLGDYHDLQYFTTQNHMKTKIDKCKKCKFHSECDGIWKDYIEIYGGDEIKPQ